MLVVVLVVFGLGSLVAALSHSIAVLVAGRAIQGAGGAVFPLAFGIIRDEFPRERVGPGIGLISATFGIGGGAGLVLGGVDRRQPRLQWIFWLALVIDRRGDRRHAPVRARVADQEPGARSTGAAPRCCRRGAGLLARASARATRWGWTLGARARPGRVRARRARRLGALRAARARAARRHADDAPARRLDDQPRRRCSSASACSARSS